MAAKATAEGIVEKASIGDFYKETQRPRSVSHRRRISVFTEINSLNIQATS